MSVRQILLLSSSKVYGHGFLEFAEQEIKEFLNRNNINKILFIPYALKDYDKYLKQVEEVFQTWGYNVDGIHRVSNPQQAVQNAQAIFVGGGNTFRLLKALYDNEIVETIRKKVLTDGVPYIGSSAGTNVATKNIKTTNDMPIVYPPTFDALNLIPFNINPHYQDPDFNSTHKGETREERIRQYQEEPEAGPVLGLREGSMLEINGNCATLKGFTNARLFIPNCEPKEYGVGADLSFLLNVNK